MRLPSEYNHRGNQLLIDLEGPAGDTIDRLRELYKGKHSHGPVFAGHVAEWMCYVRSLPEEDQIAIMLASCKLAPTMITHADVRDWADKFATKISVIYKAA